MLPSTIRLCRPIRSCRKIPVALPASRGMRNGRPFSVQIALQKKKYTKDHEWIELSEDGEIGTIGVSTYAAKALGDVVYVELPSEDTEVKAGDPIGAVESVKSASDIITPVSGVVVEANSELSETPSQINKSPEEQGWIAKVKIQDSKELETLMDEKAYTEFTEQ